MTRDQLKQLEAELWSAADNLRANSDLKSSEYSTPVLGLIFLKFADNNYRRHESEIIAEYQKLKGTRREKKLSDIAIEKCGFYLPDQGPAPSPARGESESAGTRLVQRRAV
jgi:type I restriction enzyme M protein